jgi:hypothetical protein
VLTEAALCTLGWWFVQRHRPELRLDVIGLGWRILVAGLLMGTVLYPLAHSSIFVSLPAGAIVYAAAIFFLRAIEPEEWRLASAGLVSRLRR